MFNNDFDYIWIEFMKETLSSLTKLYLKIKTDECWKTEVLMECIKCYFID